MKQYPKVSLIVLIILLTVTIYIAFIVDKIPLQFHQVMTKITTGHEPSIDAIIDLRLPRIFIALGVGAMLAVSGALLQAVFRNPLAEANIIGVSAGALLMRSIIMMLLPGLFFYIPIFSFIGGLVPFGILYLLMKQYHLSSARMILVGVALYSILNGALALFEQDPFLKISQGLTMKTWNDVYIIVTTAVIGIGIALFFMQKVNLLALDDKQANNIGFNITLYRFIVGLIAVFLASSATAIVGQMAFVGLIVPHVIRRWVGGNYKRVLPYSVLSGALLVLATDTLGRTIHPPLEIPANVFTMMIGGPLLIYMICKGALSHAHRAS